MAKAKFLFTKHFNSFSVFVVNLEKLTVQQIQEIESFVKIRKGVFDFTNYTFVIQKRIEYFEFVSLIENSSLEATVEENITIEEIQPRISFGQYKGMHYSELPDSYMLWLKNNYRGKDREFIDKELLKRKI